jgi:hypothetical protein
VCKERERESEVLPEGQVCSLFVRSELVYIIIKLQFKAKVNGIVLHNKLLNAR